MKKWKTLSTKIGFDTPYFKVLLESVELPNGIVIDDYTLWAENDVVFIFAMTKQGKIPLVKQYKHGAQGVQIEFPAGYIDKGETAESAARRELLEETGYACKSLTKLIDAYPNPTKVRGMYHYFLAEECFISEINDSKQDETESIELILKSPMEVFEMLRSGKIKAHSSIACGFMGLQALNLLSFK